MRTQPAETDVLGRAPEKPSHSRRAHSKLLETGAWGRTLGAREAEFQPQLPVRFGEFVLAGHQQKE